MPCVFSEKNDSIMNIPTRDTQKPGNTISRFVVGLYSKHISRYPMNGREKMVVRIHRESNPFVVLWAHDLAVFARP